MTNVYILGLSYTNSTPDDASPVGSILSDTFERLKGSNELEVRAGYFGICVRQRGVLWMCSSNAYALAQQLGITNDPLDLIGAMSKFRSRVLFSGLLFMAIILTLLSMLLVFSFPNWKTKHDPQTGSYVDVRSLPTRFKLRMALSLAFVAAMLLVIASLWQHIGAVGAAAMADITYYGNVKSHIGKSGVALVWVGCVVEVIAVLGLVYVIAAVNFLDKLTDVE